MPPRNPLTPMSLANMRQNDVGAAIATSLACGPQGGRRCRQAARRGVRARYRKANAIQCLRSQARRNAAGVAYDAPAGNGGLDRGAHFAATFQGLFVALARRPKFRSAPRSQTVRGAPA